MLRERYSKVEFEKIFQSFNESVYRGEMEKLNYKFLKNGFVFMMIPILTPITTKKEFLSDRIMILYAAPIPKSFTSTIILSALGLMKC